MKYQICHSNIWLYHLLLQKNPWEGKTYLENAAWFNRQNFLYLICCRRKDLQLHVGTVYSLCYHFYASASTRKSMHIRILMQRAISSLLFLGHFSTKEPFTEWLSQELCCCWWTLCDSILSLSLSPSAPPYRSRSHREETNVVLCNIKSQWIFQ